MSGGSSGLLGAEGAAVAVRAGVFGRRRLWRGVGLGVLWLVVLGNVVVVFWLWLNGGRSAGGDPAGALWDVSWFFESSGSVALGLARVTGLLGAYLALVELVLLARLSWLERLVGFDRLTVWHRWNGHACLWLILAHTFLSIWGYQLTDFVPVSYWGETAKLVWGDVLPGMITATVGTGLLVLVVVSSVVFARRRLSYELWYAVHFSAYAGIALGWFHQIPTGNDLIHIVPAERYWRGLYLVTLLLIGWRVVVPLLNLFRHRLRVSEVVVEGPGVVSLRIVGRRLDRLRVASGQFFSWRFLAPGFWWAPLPFSISAAPDGKSLRITAKALGNHSALMGGLRPGTRVVAEGPFGVFTEASRRREKVLLVAGGIGITPVRALLEEMEGDVVALYRVAAEQDLVFAAELDRLAAERKFGLHYVVGDHTTPEGRELLSPAHLKELVPDVVEREVYLCGPTAFIDVLENELRRAGVPKRHLHIERFAL